MVWVLWGSSYVAIAVMVQSMAPLLGSGSRFVISALILAAIAAVVRGPSSLKISWSQFRGSFIMGVALFGVAQGSATMALRYVPSGVAAVIISRRVRLLPPRMGQLSPVSVLNLPEKGERGAHVRESHVFREACSHFSAIASIRA